MKKRFLTILLSITMILMLMPATAMAATGDVAKVGETGYETLQAAIDSSNGAEVTLLQDTKEDIVVSSGSVVTLDLNGKTLTANEKDAIEVKIGADLTVVDNAGGGKVMANKTGYAAVLNSGKVTLSGGTYGRASEGTWYTIVNHGELMTINDGVTVENLNTADVSSLVENGYSSYSGSNYRGNYVAEQNNAAPTLTINGGSFNTAGYNAVKNDEGGVLQINGGNYTSQRASGAVIMNWNKAEITGGTFTSTKENTAVVSNGTWGDYAKGTIAISGGDFVVDENAKAVLFSFGAGSGAGGTMNVTGGNFDGDFALSQPYEVSIESCTSTKQVPAEFLGDKAGQLKMSGGSADGYYVGTSDELKKAVAAADGVTEINILSGDMDLGDVPAGIKVTNSGDGNVTVNGNELKTDESVIWYYVDANGGVPSEGNYKPGETVTIKAADAKEGEHFSGWTVVEGGITLKDATSEEILFTMPSANVVLTANYEAHTYKDGVCTVCGASDPDYEEFVPEIIKGANATWQKGDEGLSFTSNAEFADFIKVQVDGKDLNAANYTVKEGSTIVTLKASYLDTLEAGDHTLAIVSKTGTAETKFTVEKEEGTDMPKTDDSTNMMMWLALMMLAGAGAVGTKIYSRKFK